MLKTPIISWVKTIRLEGGDMAVGAIRVEVWKASLLEQRDSGQVLVGKDGRSPGATW